MLSIKRECFRQQIRKELNENEFSKRRMLTHLAQAPFQFTEQELQNQLSNNFQISNEFLTQLAEVQRPFENLMPILMHYLDETQSFKILLAGLKCINNQLYLNANVDCYFYLKRWFHYNEIEIKSAVLHCVANLIVDKPDLIQNVQLDFLADFNPDLCEAYSFLILNLVDQANSIGDVVRCLQVLEHVIAIKPNKDMYDALESIIDICTVLEVCDLIENNYTTPITKLFKLAKEDQRAAKIIVALTEKSNEDVIGTLFAFGLNILAKIYLQEKHNEEMGLLLLRSVIDPKTPVGIIDQTFHSFEDDWLYFYLLNDPDIRKVPIICLAIQHGSIFSRFLELNVVGKVFIPLLQGDHLVLKKVVLETIDHILQRDELSSQEFQWVAKCFQNQNLPAYFNYNTEDSEIFQLQESIESMLEMN